ncbi:MAG: sugar-binding protein, partial [Armatimonadota bacterium]
MCRFMIIAGLFLIVSVAAGAPLICAYRTSDPPTLDARLDEECWASASVTSPFLSLNSSDLVNEQTRVRLCWDDEHLYIGVEAFEAYLDPRLNMLHAVKAERSGEDAPVFSDDCVEIFLQPDQQNYYHFGANSGDGTYDARVTDSEWDSGWQCEARRLDDRYVLEMAIPFAALAGQPEGQWRANFARERTAIDELSTWAELQTKFHEPDAFGTLCFLESGPALTDFEIHREQSK